MAAKTTNKKTAKTEEKALESKSLYLRGILTEAMYGRREFGRPRVFKSFL